LHAPHDFGGDQTRYLSICNLFEFSNRCRAQQFRAFPHAFPNGNPRSHLAVPAHVGSAAFAAVPVCFRLSLGAALGV
jgi:hypothetical protein